MNKSNQVKIKKAQKSIRKSLELLLDAQIALNEIEHEISK